MQVKMSCMIEKVMKMLSTEKINKKIQSFLGISKDQLDYGLSLHKKSIVVDILTWEPQVWSTAQVEKMAQMMAVGKSGGWGSEIDDEVKKIRLSEFITPGHETRRVYAELLRRSGVTCISHTLLCEFGFQDALRDVARIGVEFDKARDIIMSATCADDIRKAKKEGKTAIALHFQDTVCLGKNLDNVDLFYGFGVRQVQFTHNQKNFFCDGCIEKRDSGLSYLGVKLVERMNKLGMLIDSSHCSRLTGIDMAEISKDPIAITHATCKSIFAHDRAKTDEEIQAVAEKGGVVGILTCPFYLGGKGTLKEMLDHIDYAVDLVGIDHVGIGTDQWDEYGRPQSWVNEMNKWLQSAIGFRPDHNLDWGVFTPSPDELGAWCNWPRITVGLVSRGYSEQEVQKIIGGNWLKLIEKVIG